MRKKSIGLLILFAAIFVLLAAGAVLNAVFGMVRPEISMKGSYESVFLCGNRILAADESGTVTDAADGSVLFSLPSRPVAIDGDPSLCYAACENRMLYRIEDGEICASREMNYRPAALSVADGVAYVGGTIAADRSKLYAFDAVSLDYIDLTPGEEHGDRGENESDLVYHERIYALSLDAPPVAVDARGKSVTVVTAYGGVARYARSGQLEDRRGTEYNFISADFAEDGTFYAADDNGGVIGFTAALGQIGYRALTDRDAGIAALTDGVALADRAGTVYRLDASLETLSRTGLGRKTIGFCADGDRVSLLTSDGALSVYAWGGLARYGWMIALEICLAVLAVAAAVPFIFAAIRLKGERSYRRSLDAVKSVGGKLLRSGKSYLFLLPTLILALVFAYYPAIQGLILAFFDVEPGGINTFCGLDNFRELLSATYFWSGMKNMLVFLVTDLLKGLIPAFIFAELIIAMRSKRMQYLTRVLLYLPGIIPGVAMLLIWQSGIFGMEGLLNNLVELMGGSAQNWLGQSSTAMTSLVFFGFPWVGSYIILYGSLMGIPDSFYESAKLDGCSWGRRLISIDLPMISPQLKYIFVTSFIGSVQDFQRVYMTTEGAADTYIPMLELYYNLTKFNRYGVAAAMGLVLFLVLMVATLINLKLKTVDSYD